ncbi:hypothetical protein GCM10009661_35110 [Catellatospora chokoriensis]|uniref:Lactococcin 972 family bacteriocin n=1 Tax=Catellatospora chokoriensis TaxID=310353 RepID=A0A8J3JQK8_9ACTN|nr:hypothetical protein Cch02nite_27450 [Catellatospora chokoriensis]
MERKWRTAIGVAATVAALGLAAPASATTWGTASSPYYVWEDSVAQGMAYGDFKNQNQQYARSESSQYDLRSGGQSVYVWTDWLYYYTYNGATQYWTDYSDETPHTTSASWTSKSIDKPLKAQSNSARGKVRVCEDHSFATDPCSASGYPTFSY